MSKTENQTCIPIIDLFAGPGGLGEGFSRDFGARARKFKIKLSIEKDEVAHKTLRLRAFFRQFPKNDVPDLYYAYLRGECEIETLATEYTQQWEAANDEAKCLTLGEDDVSSLIRDRLGGSNNWILIGGPPCQAYSLVGRSRMLGGLNRGSSETEEDFAKRQKEHRVEFELDPRHKLYREYLKIIGDHWPAVFVMENVKGILSAKLDNKLVFPNILSDLRDPAKALNLDGPKHKYSIFSLSTKSLFPDGNDLAAKDFLLKSEDYGVPQARHRVILIGIRDDIPKEGFRTLKKVPSVGVWKTIKDLPRLTSGLSKIKDGTVSDILAGITDEPWWKEMMNDPEFREVAMLMKKSALSHRNTQFRGGPFVSSKTLKAPKWHADLKLKGACNHETRSHIASDLWRYLFCSCYAKKNDGASPQLKHFPKGLLPAHKNVGEAIAGQKFGDRFRVQVANKPATTVTSHISKDGHYFIHYDPTQCRSLTVREAARLQTFPDNYFFEGPRTQQFHQVGNAVPPLLAYKISEIVSSIFTQAEA